MSDTNKQYDPSQYKGISGVGGIVSDCYPSRQTGKAVLKDKIAKLRKKASDLDILCKMLPEEPTAEQDEAIWKIACDL